MLALSSAVWKGMESVGNTSRRWAVAGLSLGLAAVMLYLAGQVASGLSYLSMPAASCALAGVVLSSKAYFDAREEGIFSGMATAGMALSGVYLLGGFSIAGVQTLWRVPLVIALSFLVLRQLRLYHPLTQRGLWWVRGRNSDCAPTVDVDASGRRVVLNQEEYRRLAVIGLYLGTAALILMFSPATVLLLESQVGFWGPLWLMSIRIGYLCHVVGAWFCGLAFLKLLQRGGLTASAVAGFTVNFALAAFILVGFLTANFMMAQ